MRNDTTKTTTRRDRPASGRPASAPRQIPRDSAVVGNRTIRDRLRHLHPDCPWYVRSLDGCSWALLYPPTWTENMIAAYESFDQSRLPSGEETPASTNAWSVVELVIAAEISDVDRHRLESHGRLVKFPRTIDDPRVARGPVRGPSAA